MRCRARRRIRKARGAADVANIGEPSSAADAFSWQQPEGADVSRALREARRVCRREGTVTMLVWGHKQDCDLFAVTLAAAVALLPPPPAPATTTKALSEPGAIEAIMEATDLVPTASGDIDGQFVYPDADTAHRAISSAGMIVRAIRLAGEAAVRRAILKTLAGFTRPDGSVVQKNRFHWVMATPAARGPGPS